MSAASIAQDYDKGYADGYADAIHKTGNEMLTFLKSIGVVRDSMFGKPYLVIYTEKGAIDITENRLLELRKH